jgi:hypothetical protein
VKYTLEHVSRSVSNLGSSFGTAIAGTILVSVFATGNRAYGWAMVAVAVFGLIGLGAAVLLPAKLERQVGWTTATSAKPNT